MRKILHNMLYFFSCLPCSCFLRVLAVWYVTATVESVPYFSFSVFPYGDDDHLAKLGLGGKFKIVLPRFPQLHLYYSFL